MTPARRPCCGLTCACTLASVPLSATGSSVARGSHGATSSSGMPAPTQATECAQGQKRLMRSDHHQALQDPPGHEGLVRPTEAGGPTDADLPATAWPFWQERRPTLSWPALTPFLLCDCRHRKGLCCPHMHLLLVKPLGSTPGSPH